MLIFEGKEPAMVRSSQEDFLPDDVSIMIARNKKTKDNMRIVNLLKYTNENVLRISEDIQLKLSLFWIRQLKNYTLMKMTIRY